MEEKKFKSNEKGTCPVCGGINLEWGSSDFTDDYIGYEWHCPDCDANGTEWYELVFDGHQVQVEKETEEGYTQYDYEDVNDYIQPER